MTKVTDEDYGRLPPKKLKRFKELIDSGLKNPEAITQKDLNEVARLFVEAGGELPEEAELRRGKLHWLTKEERNHAS